MSINNSKKRVIAYIDGFNLYFGMSEAGYGYCKWLDVVNLVNNLLRPNQHLIDVKYFTSRVSNSPEKQKRQSTYIEAIESKGAKVFYGTYQSSKEECQKCGHVWRSSKEKMTDVNIATAIVVDAYEDLYDTAILISGDSDLCPPVREVHNKFQNKNVFVAFPPCRHNSSLSLVAKGSMSIGRKKLTVSQLKYKVTNKYGYELEKPSEW